MDGRRACQPLPSLMAAGSVLKVTCAKSFSTAVLTASIELVKAHGLPRAQRDHRQSNGVTSSTWPHIAGSRMVLGLRQSLLDSRGLASTNGVSFRSSLRATGRHRRVLCLRAEGRLER